MGFCRRYEQGYCTGTAFVVCQEESMSGPSPSSGYDRSGRKAFITLRSVYSSCKSNRQSCKVPMDLYARCCLALSSNGRQFMVPTNFWLLVNEQQLTFESGQHFKLDDMNDHHGVEELIVSSLDLRFIFIT